MICAIPASHDHEGAMNDNPATEYAVYFPDSDCYVRDADGHIELYPTESFARRVAEYQLSQGPMAGSLAKAFEIRSRLNYTITPWRCAPESMPQP